MKYRMNEIKALFLGLITSKRSSCPELIIIKCARIKTKYDCGYSNAGMKFLKIWSKMSRSWLFISLDKNHTPRMRKILFLANLNGCEWAKYTVSIISSSSAVEFISPDNGLVKCESFKPTDHWGLLIVVAIEKNSLSIISGALNFDVDQRRFFSIFDQLESSTLDVLCLGPFKEERGCLLEKTICIPLWIETMTHIWDSDIFFQFGLNLLLPLRVYPVNCLFCVHLLVLMLFFYNFILNIIFGLSKYLW